MRSRKGPESLHPFLFWLLGRAGLDAKGYRPGPLNRRLQACQRALRAASLEQARSVLEQNPQLLNKAIDAALIGVSSFFREPQVFAALESRVLPRMAAGGGEFRFCSGGCAEGQELYSVAMILDELGVLNRCHFMGVDCRAGPLERAAAGRYAASEVGDVSPRWREQWGGDTQVCQVPARVRARFQWKKADLCRWSQPGMSWDVILFRNVAIYLQHEEATRVWCNLVAQLRPGGFLVSGKAERPPAGLGLERIEPCIYQLNSVESDVEAGRRQA